MVPAAICGMLLVLGAVCIALDPSCSARDAGSFTLSVTSRRNVTRHRVVSVDLVQEVPESSAANNETSLIVTHGRCLRGNTERVHLETVVIVLESYPKSRQRRADYELFPGLGYYKLHTTGKNWEDARVSCISEEAHLMVINSDAEAGVVKEFFSRKPKFNNVNDPLYGAYVGANDVATEGEFVTVTGELLNHSGYTRWAPGEPVQDRHQNFVGVEENALFHDITNGMRMAFICEQEF